MELLVLVWRQYRWPFISVMALSLASAALGIGLIAFINQRLGNDSNLLIVFYVQIMPDDLVMQLHRF